MDLLSITAEVDVFDLGCGSGGNTSKIAASTRGLVLGLDLSEGMVEKARKEHVNFSNLFFIVGDAQDIDFEEQFDRVYCNSAFQWFEDPTTVLKACYHALKPGGLIGIQATATANYCPQFIFAMGRVAQHPETAETFKSFKNPWLFLDSVEEYCELFKEAGFVIEYSSMVIEKSLYSVNQAYGVFKSGAENGYLNQDYYDRYIDQAYIEASRKIIKDSFNELADEKGMMELTFNRVYLTARKPF